MKLTKFEHACLILENEGKTLVVDPGAYSPGLPLDRAYDYVVITHEHGDHVDPEKLNAIVAANPKVHFFANQAVAEQYIKPIGAECTIVDDGVKASVSGFELAFYGHDHAVIYKTSPCTNTGVLVNGTFYYAGDALTVPEGVQPQVVAVPAGAPWLKTAEAMDYIKAVKPKTFFMTHDAVLTDLGKGFTENLLTMAGQEVGARQIRLAAGESLEV